MGLVVPFGRSAIRKFKATSVKPDARESIEWIHARASVKAARRVSGYLTFYPGQPQVVAQARPFQYA